jgi:hypothetical protein
MCFIRQSGDLTIGFVPSFTEVPEHYYSVFFQENIKGEHKDK